MSDNTDDWSTYDPMDGCCGRPCTQDGCHESHPMGEICVSGPDVWDGGELRLESVKQAHLIAAAPKMLAMLQEIISPVPDGRSWAMVYAERNRKVRELIAEALGQPTQPSPECLAQAAEAEDACPGGISVGGLAVEMGMYGAKGGEVAQR